MSALQQHTWPGNVRELENVIERAMIRSTGDTLLLDDTFGPRQAPRADGAGAVGDTLDAIQRAHIEAVLSECGWRINGRAQRRRASRAPPEHAPLPDEEARHRLSRPAAFGRLLPPETGSFRLKPGAPDDSVSG